MKISVLEWLRSFLIVLNTPVLLYVNLVMKDITWNQVLNVIKLTVVYIVKFMIKVKDVFNVIKIT